MTQLLTRREAAAYCGVSLSTFSLHVRPGLTPKRVGRRVLFRRSDVELWLSLQGAVGVESKPPEPSPLLDAACAIICADKQRLYLVRRPDGAIKIGVSADVTRRVKALTCAAGHPLELVADVPGGLVLEEALHRRFASSRLIGEWFRPNAELRLLAAALAAAQSEMRERAGARLFAAATRVLQCCETNRNASGRTAP